MVLVSKLAMFKVALCVRRRRAIDGSDDPRILLESSPYAQSRLLCSKLALIFPEVSVLGE